MYVIIIYYYKKKRNNLFIYTLVHLTSKDNTTQKMLLTLINS